MKTKNGMKRPGAEALKERYLRCFGVRTDNAAALQEIVKSLIDKGVSRQTLVSWASPVKYPAYGRRAWQFRWRLRAGWQIPAKRSDSRSDLDRAGAVSGLNLSPSAA